MDGIVLMIPASMSDELFNSTDIALDMMLIQAVVGRWESGLRISLAASVTTRQTAHLFNWTLGCCYCLRPVILTRIRARN